MREVAFASVVALGFALSGINGPLGWVELLAPAALTTMVTLFIGFRIDPRLGRLYERYVGGDPRRQLGTGLLPLPDETGTSRIVYGFLKWFCLTVWAAVLGLVAGPIFHAELCTFGWTTYCMPD